MYRERSRTGSVNESVERLSGLANAEQSYEAQWRLARALFFLGQESETTGAKRQLHAAAIGAGGLGMFIFRGTSMLDYRLILAGAIPAAIIALAADFGLSALERSFMKERRS